MCWNVEVVKIVVLCGHDVGDVCGNIGCGSIRAGRRADEELSADKSCVQCPDTYLSVRGSLAYCCPDSPEYGGL